MELSVDTHIEVDRSPGQVCGHYIVHLVCASTVFLLLSFHTSSTPLSSALEQSLASDPIAPVLAAKHLLALDRRLAAVLGVVRDCVAAAARPEDVVMVRDECYDNVRPGQVVDDGNFFSREKNVHHMYEKND